MIPTPEWSTACLDWEARIVAKQSLIPFAPLFPGEAKAALDILRILRIVDAPNSPMIGDCCRDWVFDFAAALFGAYDATSGRRLIRNFFQLIGKKNAKSTNAAAIMLTALLRNWRKSAEFLIIAPTIEVASNSFLPAADMIAADDELKQLLHVQHNTRTIKHLNTNATLKIVAADNETVSGKKAVGILVDELWLFGKRANAENMLREAIGGLVSRPEGFVIYLSTQSDEPPQGIFRQKLNEFRDIRDGKVVDPKSLGVLYEYPQQMVDAKTFLDPENFFIPNPNLGASVDREWLTDELVKAQRNGPASLCGFAAKHLNVEIGIGLRSDAWAGAEFWQACADPKITLDYIIEKSEIVCVGIDGGGLDDLLGFAVLGRHKHNRDWLLWTHAWAHQSVLARRKEIVPALLGFEDDGDLSMVLNVGDDVAEVCDIVERLESAGLLPPKIAVGVDQIGIAEIVDELTQRGITGERIGGVPQGWKLNNAIKTLERRLAGRTIRHSGSRMMDWVLGNAKAEPRGNAVTISKQLAGSAKIDPLMAAFDAVVALGQNPESTVSVYEERPMLVL